MNKNRVNWSTFPIAVMSLYWNLVLPFILEYNHSKVQSTIVQALSCFLFFFGKLSCFHTNNNGLTYAASIAICELLL